MVDNISGALKLIQRLHKLGVTLKKRSGRLVTRGPKNAISEDLARQIRNYKSDLLGLVDEEDNQVSSLDEPLTIKNIYREEGTRYPVSTSQRQIWTRERMAAEHSGYSKVASFSIRGDFVIEAAQKAIDQIVERHEILRTNYKYIDGVVYQFVRKKQESYPTRIVVSKDILSSRDNYVEQRVRELEGEDIDLENDLVLYAEYLELTGDFGYLLIRSHHIAFDEESLNIFISEFVYFYGSFIDAEKYGPISKLEWQYIDYAWSQDNWLKGGILDKKLEYWVHAMKGVPKTCRPHPDLETAERQRIKSSTYTFDISAEEYSRVRADITDSRATVHTYFLTVLAMLLAKHTNSTDIVIGIPVSTRHQRGMNKNIGMFSNVLPIRVIFDTNDTFKVLLRKVQQKVYESVQNSAAPFDAIASIANKEKNRTFLPLVQVMFSHIVAADHKYELPNLVLEYTDRTSESNRYDLHLTVKEHSDKMEVSCEYNSHRYSDKFIRLLAERLRAHIRELSVHDDKKYSEYSFFTEEDKKKVFRGSVINNNRKDNVRIENAFKCVALQHPERVAVSFNSTEVSYLELSREADLLSRKLSTIISKDEKRVGLYFDRSIEMVVSMLAVLQCGFSYVPIDPKSAMNRNRRIIEDAQLRYIVVGIKNADAPCITSTKRVTYEYGDCGVSTVIRDRERGRPKGGEEIAYVMYTSGTTGEPKGVQITHENVLSLYASTKEIYDFNETDVWTMFHSYAFDYSVWEIWGSLLTGCKMVIVPYSVAISPREFRALVRKEQITMLSLTPSMFAKYQEIDVNEVDETRVRNIVLSGESFAPASLKPWIAKYGSNSPAIHNMYGITETTVFVTHHRLDLDEVSKGRDKSNIGWPIANWSVLIVGINGEVLPPGVVGEMYVGGKGLSPGYLANDALNTEKFVLRSFGESSEQRYYRSGDLAKLCPHGSLEYIGRSDDQVQLRGYRIELGEIEAALNAISNVTECKVLLGPDKSGESTLSAYLVIDYMSGSPTIFRSRLLERLKAELPQYMVPQTLYRVSEIPLNVNGKIDKKRLLEGRRHLGGEPEQRSPTNTLQKDIYECWKRVLRVDSATVDDNFFDSGGNSLLCVTLQEELNSIIGCDLMPIDIFEYPTIRSLERRIGGQRTHLAPRDRKKTPSKRTLEGEIAIVGISGKFPDAENVEEFWDNIFSGKVSIEAHSEEQILRSGVKKTDFVKPNYVGSRVVFRDAEKFDAQYFGISPKAAITLNPQHRLLLEQSVVALEDAGYMGDKHGKSIGVYYGVGENGYEAKFDSFESRKSISASLEAQVGSSRNFSSSLVSYYLDLDGPSISVASACSTSLACIHVAIQGLIAGDCDLALAGASAVTTHSEIGYLHERGSIASKDGFCRPFDVDATGTIRGDGVGIVVLRPLADALGAKDNVYAVIKSIGVSNDGKNKVGFTAPSIDGQKRAIESAILGANLGSGSVAYLEAHGTGTKMGDPIEIEAATRAYSSTSIENCAIGSVKANIGHLDAAAGMAGIIKTIGVIKHGKIPPQAGFRKQNDAIDFAATPFYVNTALKDWDAHGSKRIAAVSSFGIGGTNYHAILEEKPNKGSSVSNNRPKLVLVSGMNEAALARTKSDIATYIKTRDDLRLEDAAFTLQVGRKDRIFRKAIVADHKGHAVAQLTNDSTCVNLEGVGRPKVVFMFPGQGFEYSTFARELYSTIAPFRRHMDDCAGLVLELYGFNILDSISESSHSDEDAGVGAELSQIIAFAVQYSIAKVLTYWGVRAEYVVGHSLGEYAAACIADVLSLRDTLKLLHERERLMRQCPNGAMILVEMTEDNMSEITKRFGLEVAAINSTNRLVLSGNPDSVRNLEDYCVSTGISHKRLNVDRAYHSSDMEFVHDEYADTLESVKLCPPRINYCSTVTGTLLTGEICSTEYWHKQIRKTVKFKEAVCEILDHSSRAEHSLLHFIEIGGVNNLVPYVRALADLQKASAYGSLSSESGEFRHMTSIYRMIGKLWEHGVNVDWNHFSEGNDYSRVSLPRYKFQQNRFWPIEEKTRNAIIQDLRMHDPRFYKPIWTIDAIAPRDVIAENSEDEIWIIFTDDENVMQEARKQITTEQHGVIVVSNGDRYMRSNEFNYYFRTEEREDYFKFVEDIDLRMKNVNVLHLTALGTQHDKEGIITDTGEFERLQRKYSLGFLFLLQALSTSTATHLNATTVSSNTVKIISNDRGPLQHSSATSICVAATQEIPNVRCRHLDFDLDIIRDPASIGECIASVVRAHLSQKKELFSAYRLGQRYIREFIPLVDTTLETDELLLKENGVYLITGGLGKAGLKIARLMASRGKTIKLYLVGRSGACGGKIQKQEENSQSSSITQDVQSSIAEIEACGASVTILSADVSDLEKMKDTISVILSESQTIHGVIHAAGITELELKSIHALRPSDFEKHYPAKIYGTLILDSLLEGVNLDFCVSMSSISSILGGVGMTGYASANMFMDNYSCFKNHRLSCNWISVNWDGWDSDNTVENCAMEEDERLGIMLSRVFSNSQLAQLLQSNGDIYAKAARWLYGDHGKNRRSAEAVEISVPNVTPAGTSAVLGLLERRVASIWEDLLGVSSLQHDIEIYSYGGDSLTIVRFLGIVEEEYGLDQSTISLEKFFETPTIGGFASHLEIEIEKHQLSMVSGFIEAGTEVEEGTL